MATSSGRVMFDAAIDVGPAGDVPREAYRRFRADRRARREEHIKRRSEDLALHEDAEIDFTGGELDGLKLVGFAVWRRRDGRGQNVSLPSRHFTVDGDRRSFSLLRWIAKRR